MMEMFDERSDSEVCRTAARYLLTQDPQVHDRLMALADALDAATKPEFEKQGKITRNHPKDSDDPFPRDKQSRRVLALHQRHPLGLSNDEVSELLGISMSTIGARANFLTNKKWLEVLDEKRETRQGGSSNVRRITHLGVIANARAYRELGPTE